jgi:hypothetical protein
MNFVFKTWIQATFMEQKRLTVAHVRDIPSDSEDSELYDEDVGNNYAGIISVSESNDDQKNVPLLQLQKGGRKMIWKNSRTLRDEVAIALLGGNCFQMKFWNQTPSTYYLVSSCLSSF